MEEVSRISQLTFWKPFPFLHDTSDTHLVRDMAIAILTLELSTIKT